ncbi:uncharacterized protein [Clytia hemisphaerica]|uniref:Fibronectin type-III domain-containing protein n=1 Tax=Clytia hemisphaerica TaxID=252671 RepID=A0A7M5V556_9CNID
MNEQCEEESGFEERYPDCNTQPCPVDGEWSSWTNVSLCDTSCYGLNTHIRARQCNNPEPRYGGLDCLGDGEQILNCSCLSTTTTTTTTTPTTTTTTPTTTTTIPTTTTTTPTTTTTTPTTTTTSTTTTPTTTTTIPTTTTTIPTTTTTTPTTTTTITTPPTTMNQPTSMTSPTTKASPTSTTSSTATTAPRSTTSLTTTTKSSSTTTRITTPRPAPINGGWSDWRNWSECTPTCGKQRMKTKERKCDQPSPQNGGILCVGISIEHTQCENVPCPGVWGQWSSCQSSEETNSLCGEGVKRRHCIEGVCVGNDTEICQIGGICNLISLAPFGMNCSNFCHLEGKACDKEGFVAPLDIFKSLDTNCFDWSIGQSSITPYFDNSTKRCYGLIEQKEVDCQSTPNDDQQRLCKCIEKTDITEGKWSQWSECSASCNGQKTRHRICDFDDPDFQCTGQTQTEDCSAPCPVNGGLSSWSSWEECTKTCGGGRQHRYRYCTNPSPSNGGAFCVGLFNQSRICGVGKCPVNGGWTNWTEWSSACSKPCNTGHMTRQRFCTNPQPLYGGQSCPGNSTEYKGCHFHPCEEIDVEISVSFDEEFQEDDFVKRAMYKLRFDKFRVLLNNSGFDESIKEIDVNRLRSGSVITDMTITFQHLDSFQLIFMMDSFDNGQVFEIRGGKISITFDKPSNFSTDKVPPAPTNTSFQQQNGSWIISWSKVNNSLSSYGNVSGYIFFYKESFEPSSSYRGIATKDFLIILNNLKINTEYVFRILAYNDIGNGIPTQQYSLGTTQNNFKGPSKPVLNLQADTTSFSTIQTTWDLDPSEENSISGYHVTYTGNDTTNQRTVFHPSTSIGLEDLEQWTDYVIEVCSFNSFGQSPCQTTAATTLVKDGLPEVKVSGLEQIYKTHNEIHVSWLPLATTIIEDLIGYHVKIWLHKQDGRFVVGSSVVEESVSLAVNSFRFSSLESNSIYKVSVSVENTRGKGQETLIEASTCSCEEIIYTNFFVQPPYTSIDVNSQSFELQYNGLFPDLLKKIIPETCGVCQMTSTQNYTTQLSLKSNGNSGLAFKRKYQRVLDDIDSTSKITFPMTSSPNDQSKFVSIIDYPGAVLLNRKVDSEELVNQILQKLASCWTIVFIYLMLCVLSALVLWGLDHFSFSTNQQFAKSLADGLKETFYYAFITQSTVGYGDMVVKTKRARCFIMFWMLVCQILTSLIVGALSSAFTTVVIEDVSLYGKKIGALNGSFEINLAIVRNAKVDNGTIYTTPTELLTALTQKEVHGVLMDAYTASSMRNAIDLSGAHPVKLVEYPRYYGVVLSGHLKYIAHSMEASIHFHEKDIVEMIAGQTDKMKPPNKFETYTLFDTNSPTLMDAVKTLLWMLFTAVVLGLIFSACRFHKKRTQVEGVDNTVDTSLSIRPIWREVIKLHYVFCHRVYNLQTRMDQERIKLYRDKGASSLRNNNRFHLYSKEKYYSSVEKKVDTKIAQTFRKLSRMPLNNTLSELNNNKKHDFERGDYSHSNNNNDVSENLPTFRKISISKRKRRGKESIAGFSRLHDLEEEQERTQSDFSMRSPSLASMRSYNERIKDLDSDLDLYNQGYDESDIESDLSGNRDSSDEGENRETDSDSSDGN